MVSTEEDEQSGEEASATSEASISDNELPEITCLCQKAPHGEMVGCDNAKCPIEWFHLACVGLDKPPTASTWLCPKCQALNK